MVRIVVGVDGSTPSKQALRWALDEARLRGASLRVVSAWTVPIFVANGLAPVAIPDPGAARDAARQRLDSVVSEIVGNTRDVPIEQVVVEGTAAEKLIGESKGANLWWLGRAATGALQGCCSARSATSAPPMRLARL